MILCFAGHEKVCEWASNKIMGIPDGWDEKARAMSVIKDDRLICAVVYSDYRPNISIEMSIASVDKTWCNRHNLRAFFSYPFIDLGVKRVTTLCSANKGDIVNFNKRIGFKPEGYHRQAWIDGGDTVSFGMLKDECKWL